MNARFLHRSAAFALVCIMALAACGGSETTDADTDVETTEAAAETTATTEATATTVGVRSPEQIAIDELDVSMYQLGVRDLAGVSDCVVERMEAEGFNIVEDEAAELAALIGCEPSVSSSLFGDLSGTFGAEAWTCTTDQLAEWIGNAPLADAQSIFAAPTPPAELVTLVSDTCGVSESDFLAIFG